MNNRSDDLNNSDPEDRPRHWLTDLLEVLMRIDTWHKVGMFIILSTWLALVWDFVANKGATQREYLTTFVGASKRPVLFAEDYVFINNLLKKYPNSDISVIEVNYLAGIASKPLTDINTADRVVLNKSGVPIAAILMSRNTPQAAKDEVLRYFKGNDNISPEVPLTPPTPTGKPNAKLNPATASPISSPLAVPRGN